MEKMQGETTVTLRLAQSVIDSLGMPDGVENKPNVKNTIKENVKEIVDVLETRICHEERLIEKNIKEMGNTLGKKAKELGYETKSIWIRFGQIFIQCVGVFVLIIGTSALLVVGTLLLGFESNAFKNDIKDICRIFSGLPPDLLPFFKLAVILAVIIPIAGFLYSGIKLLWGFKKPNLKIGLLFSILWLISFFAAIGMAIASTVPYWNSITISNSDFLEEKKDTIYVKYADNEKWQGEKSYVSGNKHQYCLFYSGYFDGDYQVVIYPILELRKKAYQNAFYIESHYTLFPNRITLNELHNLQATSGYQFENDTLFLHPVIYTKEDKVKKTPQKLLLNIENTTVVMVDSPVQHQFENKFRYNNMECRIRWRY